MAHLVCSERTSCLCRGSRCENRFGWIGRETMDSGNREVVLAAVQQNGLLLDLAADELRADREFTQAALGLDLSN